MKTLVTALLVLLFSTASLAAPLPKPRPVDKDFFIGEWQAKYGSSPDPKAWILFFEDGTYVGRYFTTSLNLYFGYWDVKDDHTIIMTEGSRYDYGDEPYGYNPNMDYTYKFTVSKDGQKVNGRQIATSQLYVLEDEKSPELNLTRIRRNTLSIQNPWSQ